ncbi:DUF5666 domain-containing protein [Cyanobium gracile UHCC 0139]|uniref:DUF5666 domain-containing protein n=1 Tax=Cyanobium gracile UHCC 0139 TaxID=3110308 RepID=A0ABU5RXB8_9CYAN|nr:DUF5666 domain-containing protein [Cyanobium gracile]MEA5392430.1 DUF5666 domain-containing protein [Cyanobium gracile UHCC 0139]
MNLLHHTLAASLLLGTVATPVLADSSDSLEGKIQSIDAGRRSFVVRGQTFLTNAATDYDDGLKTFSDLKTGMKVKVDHSRRGGTRYAKEIELDD